ncbi:MAG: aryl-sulfate sulfotransferase [candidate division KSB1 bacterium]|jgi:hypothetical protein|nr:aryl-sulfate sulfotransferase [candidate division KSB1 bacterium]
MSVADSWDTDIQYLHPLPGSRLVSQSTTIILRFEKEHVINLEKDVSFAVYGSRSGPCIGETVLSSDSRTLIFKPSAEFQSGERVSVDISTPKHQDDYQYTFLISTTRYNNQQPLGEHNDFAFSDGREEYRIINGVSVPGDFPSFKPSVFNNPSEGMIFISTGNYLMILRNDGTPYYYRKTNSRLWGFTLQAGGMLSFMDGATPNIMDKRFEIIDYYKCGHGFKTDHHEFRYLKNGHTLLIAEDIQEEDMSLIVPGGKVNARIVGNHIQELDRDKNVIFEWRCWDHYDIADALHENLKAYTIRSVHMNAIDVDYDGHYLVSSRRLDEVTKIDRSTGEIIWRLGGRKNQFTFMNDPDGFTYQHDIRAVPGKPGHYTLMDNGNYHDPKYSRAVEYRLDIVTMTAEKVWEYRHTPDRYAYWMGNVQRLPNGNTVIGWSTNQLPKMTEVTPGKEIVYEGDFSDRANSYRVHRYQWDGKAIRPYLFVELYPDKVTLLFNQFGACNIEKFRIYADIHEHPTTLIDSTDNTYIHLTSLPNMSTNYFRVTSVDSSGVESDFSNEVSAFINLYEPGDNMILNGDFSDQSRHWRIEIDDPDMASWDIDDEDQFHMQVNYTRTNPADVKLIQQNLRMVEGVSYQLAFDAYADQDRILDVKVLDASLRVDYSRIGSLILTDEKQRYVYDFVMSDETDSESQIVFYFAHAAGEVVLDNISLKQRPSAVIEDIAVKNSMLFSNYPNPFNNQTMVEYRLKVATHVSLKVYDVLGRELITLCDRITDPGVHRISWDGLDARGRQMPSGIYFFRLKSNDREQVHKAIILK